MLPLMLLSQRREPQVVINNGSPATPLTDKKSDEKVPADVTKYESPGTVALITLSAGALFGVYKLWKTMYSYGCQALSAN